MSCCARAELAINSAAPNPSITICIRILFWNFMSPSILPLGNSSDAFGVCNSVANISDQVAAFLEPDKCLKRWHLEYDPKRGALSRQARAARALSVQIRLPIPSDRASPVVASGLLA